MPDFPNSGALFNNDRKTSNKHPDFTGQGTVNGTDYWISGWKKESKDGKKFVSLSFTPKEERGGAKTEGGRYSSTDDFEF